MFGSGAHQWIKWPQSDLAVRSFFLGSPKRSHPLGKVSKNSQFLIVSGQKMSFWCDGLLLQIALRKGHFHQQVVVLDWRHDAILWLNCGSTCVCDWVQVECYNIPWKMPCVFQGFFFLGGGKLCREFVIVGLSILFEDWRSRTSTSSG